MKKLFLLLLLFPFVAKSQFMIAATGSTTETPSFEFGITTLGEDDSFAPPLYNGGTYDFVIDWGDASSSTITAFDDGDLIHTYADAGASSYNISISGILIGWKFDNAGDKALMKDITQWGCFRPGNTGDAFKGCSNLTVSATDIMNLSSVTDFNEVFQLCTSLTTVPSMNSWNMSNITTFYGMFHTCTQLNQDISGWNTSSCTNMGYMFYHCDAFNQNIGSWDVSHVTIMTWMFYEAGIFNGNISSWTTSALSSCSAMFRNDAAFNQDISGWDMDGVSDFGAMFLGCTSFNQSISGWDMSSATDISHMFNGATAYDQNLAAWVITGVTDASSMFNGVTLSTANYNALLIGWEAQNEHINVTFDGGNSLYSAGAATTAKAALVTSGWIITDGGQEE